MDAEISHFASAWRQPSVSTLTSLVLDSGTLSCGMAALPTISSQGGYLTLSCRENKQATDLTFTVQATDSPASGIWSPASTVVAQEDMGGYWLVTVRDNVTMAGHPTRRARGSQTTRPRR